MGSQDHYLAASVAERLPKLPSLRADVRLNGEIDDNLLRDFLGQLDAVATKTGPIVVEMTTTGGDADIGRRMALEIRLLRERAGKDLWFFGKSTVYSSGVTVMSAFPVERRFLSDEASLLVHQRWLERDLKLSGSLRTTIAQVKDLLAELDHGQSLEHDAIADLVRGTPLSIDEVMARIMDVDWYLRAPEALRLGLVAGLV